MNTLLPIVIIVQYAEYTQNQRVNYITFLKKCIILISRNLYNFTLSCRSDMDTQTFLCP